MRKVRKKQSRFQRFTKHLFFICLMTFSVGSVALNSYESSLNIQGQQLEKDITAIESDIDGLTLQKQQLATFSRVASIAQEKGYTYKQNTVTAAVVGVQKD